MLLLVQSHPPDKAAEVAALLSGEIEVRKSGILTKGRLFRNLVRDVAQSDFTTLEAKHRVVGDIICLMQMLMLLDVPTNYLGLTIAEHSSARVNRSPAQLCQMLLKT